VRRQVLERVHDRRLQPALVQEQVLGQVLGQVHAS